MGCRSDNHDPVLSDIVLWREGNLAVVSGKTRDGRWLRLVEADCRGMFHEQSNLDGRGLVLRARLLNKRARHRRIVAAFAPAALELEAPP